MRPCGSGSLELAADRFGFREYYNPISGRGLGARDFGFATLLIDLEGPAEASPVGSG